jgi:hypothetical protein
MPDFDGAIVDGRQIRGEKLCSHAFRLWWMRLYFASAIRGISIKMQRTITTGKRTLKARGPEYEGR